jgi:hypothetical protein
MLHRPHVFASFVAQKKGRAYFKNVLSASRTSRTSCKNAYFLGLERKYRNLYDEVRKMEESKIDFSMSISKFNVFKKNSMFYCAFSSTLIFFYGPLLLAVLYVILFLK